MRQTTPREGFGYPIPEMNLSQDRRGLGSCGTCDY